MFGAVHVHRGLDRAGRPALIGTNPPRAATRTSRRFRARLRPEAPLLVLPSADCSGQPLGVGTAADLVEGGIEISVSDNTTTPLSALATDAAGNVSTCSASISYAEVTLIPGPPGFGDQACAKATAKLDKAKRKLKKAKESGKKNRIKKAKAKVKKAKQGVTEACG